MEFCSAPILDLITRRSVATSVGSRAAQATADGRLLTITPVEPEFWSRLCELIGRPDLVELHYDEDQESLAAELASVFARRPLSDWLELFEGEDVMAGPVATLAEAAATFGEQASTDAAPALGGHTEQWRAELAPFGG